MPKPAQLVQESNIPHRGRPRKDDAMVPAERARRYRERKKAQGLVTRYVSEETDPEEVHKLRERLVAVISERNYFKAEVARLHQENDALLSRATEAERFHTNALKEIIVTRRKLVELQKSPLKLAPTTAAAKVAATKSK